MPKRQKYALAEAAGSENLLLNWYTVAVAATRRCEDDFLVFAVVVST